MCSTLVLMRQHSLQCWNLHLVSIADIVVHCNWSRQKSLVNMQRVMYKSCCSSARCISSAWNWWMWAKQQLTHYNYSLHLKTAVLLPWLVCSTVLPIDTHMNKNTIFQLRDPSMLQVLLLHAILSYKLESASCSLFGKE